MKITLINCTAGAEDLLLFTKDTRLGLDAGKLNEVAARPNEEKLAGLEYMANTIPSSWEMVDYVFLIEGVSRAFTHQFVRTRHGSYAQQSLRVVGMNDFDYVYPDRELSPRAREIVDDVLAHIKVAYRLLTQEEGVPTEDARGILPTNVATNIVAKFNLRTLSELAKSRTGGRTQQEYQRVMSAMADAVLAVHPWAEKFLFPAQRDYFDEIEAFAERQFGGDLLKKGELLKIVDKMRARR